MWPQVRQRLRLTQLSSVSAQSSHTGSATGAQSSRTSSTCSQGAATREAYASWLAVRRKLLARQTPASKTNAVPPRAGSRAVAAVACGRLPGDARRVAGTQRREASGAHRERKADPRQARNLARWGAGAMLWPGGAFRPPGVAMSEARDLHERPAELLRRLLRFDTTNPPGSERACLERSEEHTSELQSPDHLV